MQYQIYGVEMRKRPKKLLDQVCEVIRLMKHLEKFRYFCARRHTLKRAGEKVPKCIGIGKGGLF